ncbi:unnamed protein product [Diplocarpon coronariae]
MATRTAQHRAADRIRVTVAVAAAAAPYYDATRCKASSRLASRRVVLSCPEEGNSPLPPAGGAWLDEWRGWLAYDTTEYGTLPSPIPRTIPKESNHGVQERIPWDPSTDLPGVVGPPATRHHAIVGGAGTGDRGTLRLPGPGSTYLELHSDPG